MQILRGIASPFSPLPLHFGSCLCVYLPVSIQEVVGAEIEPLGVSVSNDVRNIAFSEIKLHLPLDMLIQLCFCVSHKFFEGLYKHTKTSYA